MASSPVFPDMIEEYLKNGEEASLAFFELANAREVAYRLSASQLLFLGQDVSACGQHTGGIVWETSYLLLEYLLAQNEPLGRTLEVGAGCGLLGQALAYHNKCKTAVLTEAAEVLVNLDANVKRNKRIMGKMKDKIRVCQLDWTKPEEDSKLASLTPHSFDTILGTDVIFTPTLVEPLLKTLRFMVKKDGLIYLCVQVRCAASHELLLDQAQHYGFEVQDISSDYCQIPTCHWGMELECHLFLLTAKDK